MERRALVVLLATVLILLVGSVSNDASVTALLRATIGEPRHVFLAAGIVLGVASLAQPWLSSRSRRDRAD